MISKLLKLLETPKAILAKILLMNHLHAHHILSARKLTDQDFRTIIDVGANVGQYTEVANYLFPDSDIYSFEPTPDIFNKRLPAKFFNFGLWDQTLEKQFNLKQESVGNSFFDYVNGNEWIKNKMIEVKRFDELNIKIKSPCLLKLDTEGSELNVLKGFGERLKEIDVLQIEILFTEEYYGQYPVPEVMIYLESFGFKGFIQKSVRYKGIKPIKCDLIFFK